MRGCRVPIFFRLLLCALVVELAVVTPLLPAEETDAATLTEKVDALFAKWDKPDSPGCALGVIQGGKFVYKRGYGMASLEHSVPISSTTAFYIASASKQFTAASVLLAAEQGSLALDDDIRKYLPEMPDYGSPITIRHLVHHISGLRDRFSLTWLADVRWDDDQTVEEVLALLARQKELNFTPGTDWAYTGSNYELLGQIIRRATGKSLREFTEENIFALLGMKNTHFHDDSYHVVKNRAMGYSPGRGNSFRLARGSNWDRVGSGGIYTTVEDFLLWDQNFYQNKLGGKDFVRRLLTPGSLANGKKLDYAYGLIVGEYKGLRTIAHGGTFSGFRAATLRFPDQEFSVACFCNHTALNIGQLASRVADIYLTGQFSEPEFVELSEEDLKDKTGTYLNPLGLALEFWLNEGTLLVRRKGSEGATQLAPLSKTRFHSLNPRFPNEYEFYREDPNSPWRMDVSPRIAGGMRSPLRLTFRAAQFIPPQAQLEEYVGEYESDEVPATYKVLLEKGKLMAERKNAPTTPLRPTIKDQFRLGGVHVVLGFVRDEQGRVTGFNFKGGGIWNLRFVKKQ